MGAAEQHSVGTPGQAQTRGFDIRVGRLPPRALGPCSPTRGCGFQRKGECRHSVLRRPGADKAHGTGHNGTDCLLREREGRGDDTVDRFILRDDPCDDFRTESGEVSCLERAVRHKRCSRFLLLPFLLFLGAQNRTVEKQAHRLAQVYAVLRLPSRGRLEIDGQAQPWDSFLQPTGGFR